MLSLMQPATSWVSLHYMFIFKVLIQGKILEAQQKSQDKGMKNQWDEEFFLASYGVDFNTIYTLYFNILCSIQCNLSHCKFHLRSLAITDKRYLRIFYRSLQYRSERQQVQIIKSTVTKSSLLADKLMRSESPISPHYMIVIKIKDLYVILW